MNIRFFLLSISVAALALGQPPAPPRPTFDNIKTYLGLSDAVVQSIETAIQTNRSTTATLRDTLATKQKAVAALLAAGSTDAAAVGKAVLDAEAVRKQVKAQDDALQTTVLTYLTAAQKTKLATLQDAANLRPNIEEAMRLHLMTPPAGSGPGGMAGPGSHMMGGPRGMGGPEGPGHAMFRPDAMR